MGYRATIAVLLLAVAGLGVFGFLATHEPPGFPRSRLLYAILALGCLAGAGWVVRRAPKSARRGSDR